MTTSVKLRNLLIGVALLPFLTSAAQFSIRQREDLRKLKKMMSKGSKGRGNKLVVKDAILDRCMNLDPRPSTTVQSVEELKSVVSSSRQGLRRNQLVRVDVNLTQALDCSSMSLFATLSNQCVFISGGGTIPKDCFLHVNKNALISLDNISLEGIVIARDKKKSDILLKDATVKIDCSSNEHFVPQTAVTVQGKTGFHVVCGGLEELEELVNRGWFDFESISDDAYVRLDGYFDTPVVDILNGIWPDETPQPSSQPSDMPSNMPSDVPSDLPSAGPSAMPSDMPSVAPSDLPSAGPSDIPSNVPSVTPSESPSVGPSAMPTCSSGDIGCPCITNDQCSDDLRCFSTTNTCQEPYENDSGCTDDNECRSKLCRDTTGTGRFCLETYQPLNDVFFREKAVRAMELSAATYKDESVIRERFGNGEYNKTACADNKSCVGVYDFDGGLDRALVVRDPGRCYIAFRGTQGLDDASKSTRGCAGEDRQVYDVGTGCNFRADACYQSWLQPSSIRDTILPPVRSCLEDCKGSNNGEACELVITGHSKGGCQATAATYALSQALQAEAYLVEQQYTITFGPTPAVFETATSAGSCNEMFAPLKDYIFNFVNTEDRGTTNEAVLVLDPVPFKELYANCFDNLRHVGNMIFLQEGSEDHVKYFDEWNQGYTNLPMPLFSDVELLIVHASSAYRVHICTLFMGDKYGKCEKDTIGVGSPSGDFRLPLTVKNPIDDIIYTGGFQSGAACFLDREKRDTRREQFAELLCSSLDCLESVCFFKLCFRGPGRCK